MKKITEEEANAMVTKPLGRVSFMRAMLLSLKPQEHLLVEKKDWTWKRTTPSVMCRRLEEGSALKFDCKRLLNGTGWIIKRVK